MQSGFEGKTYKFTVSLSGAALKNGHSIGHIPSIQVGLGNLCVPLPQAPTIIWLLALFKLSGLFMAVYT